MLGRQHPLAAAGGLPLPFNSRVTSNAAFPLSREDLEEELLQMAAAFAGIAICTRGLSVTDSASRDTESMLVGSRATSSRIKSHSRSLNVRCREDISVNS